MHTYQAKTFRDRPQNIDQKGRKKNIKAKQPKGKWYTRRTIVGWTFLLFLILAPFIKINGNPFMLINIAERRFILFGATIWAQDSFLIAMIMLVVVVSIVLFTVAFGRLWCGWACPQTLFLEFVFRPLEYLFDGNLRNGNKRKKNKLRLIIKHITFFIISIFFTHAFLNWFIGPERLFELIQTPIQDNLIGFSLMLGISVFYYWIYAFFREQVCTMICPYGRIQGVLLDSKTINVIYDFKRGEPRGSKTGGDCIDCKQCISVCPTGIDIKNGSQLECINCTACIDECNTVMRKIGKPGNLIRFDSYHGIETGKHKLGNSRTYAYSAVLVVLFIVLGFTVAKRTAVETSFLRIPGTTYQRLDERTLSNVYNLKLINKTRSAKDLNVRILSPENGQIEITSGNLFVDGFKGFESAVIIKLNSNDLIGKSTPVSIGIFENDILLEIYETNFIGPTNN